MSSGPPDGRTRFRIVLQFELTYDQPDAPMPEAFGPQFARFIIAGLRATEKAPCFLEPGQRCKITRLGRRKRS